MDGMGNISAEDIRRGRERLMLTQQELADELGVSRRTVGSWERGERVPRNRQSALIEVLRLDEPNGPEFGRDALIKRLGYLAKSRREQLGYSRDAFAEDAEVAEKTVRDFEFGRRIPNDLNQAKIEKVLNWRHGAMAAALEKIDRKASSLEMEELDAWDTRDRFSLAAIPTADLLRELIDRLQTLEHGVRAQAPRAEDLYGLAAMGHIPEHLEQDDEDEEGKE